MQVEELAKNIVGFEMEREPYLNNELKTVTDVVGERADCDVILDFAKIDIITSPSLAKLLKLRQMQIESGYRLILCNVHTFTRSAFMVTGLDGLFELAEDKSDAMAILQAEWFKE